MKEEIETRNVAEMVQSKNRQAGEEIKVTPEMIEAGSAILCRMTLALADEEFWAEEVYRAMTVLVPRSS